MKKLTVILISLALLFAFVSCSDSSSSAENQNSSSSSGSSSGSGGSTASISGRSGNSNSIEGKTSSSYTAAVSSRTDNPGVFGISDIAEDTVSLPDWDETIYINLTNEEASLDNENWVSFATGELTLNGNRDTILQSTGTDLKRIDVITGKENLKVVITGSGSKALYFDTKKAYAIGLFLQDASISSTLYPCIQVDSKSQTYVNISGSNSLTDGRSFGTDYSAKGSSKKGTLFSKGCIVMDGDGSLTITEAYKHGVNSNDFIRVLGGTYTINSSGRNGFQSVNGFIMDGGNISINGSGTHTNNQSRGIVVEGSDDEEEETVYAGEGFIVIKDGTLNINTVGKGITAKWDIDEDAVSSVTTDDPYPYVKIIGGTINITTTGTPTEGRTGTYTDADGESVTEEIKLAPEGIEGKQSVFISGGTITLKCTDDCINASRDGSAVVEISGGTIYAKSTLNDAIDSNGNLVISGGTVVAIAANTPECAFDCDSYTFSITGGTIAGIGTPNYSEPTASKCTQGVLVLGGSMLGSAGKTIAIKNASGNVVYAFTVPTSGSGLVGIFSGPALTNKSSYTLLTGATATGGTQYNGLYTTMPSVSNGNSYTGLSFGSSYLYTSGVSSNGGPMEGDRTGGGAPMH